MRIKSYLVVILSLASACGLGCSASTNAPTGIAFNHPLASDGGDNLFIDGVAYPFATDLDYAEYYAGADLEEEYSYYTKKGFHTFFNLDINADSEFVQFMILDVDLKPGVYEVRDTELAGIARTNYEFDDTITNAMAQHVLGGSFEITSVDITAKRISGVYVLHVINASSSTPHLIEGSFTNVYLKYGADGGEVATADVSANSLNSAFTSTRFYQAFGNGHGQGIKGEDYFAVSMSTEGLDTNGYESLQFFIKKPVPLGTVNLEPRCAIYTRYILNPATAQYTLVSADTNLTAIPDAAIVTDFDKIRRRASGTFAFSITDSSARSPITVSNGKFVDLFWW